MCANTVGGKYLLMYSALVAISATSPPNGRFDTNINSQHFMNGTTALERNHKDNKISMHFNEARHLEVPLFNYTNFFNRLEQSNNEDLLHHHTWTTVKPQDDELKDTIEEKKRIECEDDKAELEFLHFQSISLANNFTRLAIDCNFTLTKYDQCKKERESLEKKLNYTSDSWNACKRFCSAA